MLPPTPLPCLARDDKVSEISLQALETRCAAEARLCRIAGSEVPMSATVGSTWEGIQNVRP